MLIDMPDSLQADTAKLLTAAGFEVLKSGASFEEIKSFRPRVVLLNLAPASLACCDVLSSLRANQATKEIRVIALVKGEAEARARALDLGANVAIPESVHPAELLAQVRLQLRESEQVERVERELERAVEHEHELQAQMRQTVPFRRLLVWTLAALGSLLVIGAIVFAVITILGRRQTNQVRNTLATLQRSVMQQQELLAEVQKEREALQKSYGKAVDAQTHLTAEQDRLSKQLANSEGAGAATEQQLRDTEKRLQRLEMESNAGRRIVEEDAPSVALLHVVVGFQHIESGKFVTVGKNPPGENNQSVTLELGGDGPEFRLDSFGTAFIAGKSLLVTNHHVAEPWWQNDELKALLDRGVKPVVRSMDAYFPGLTVPLTASTAEISQAADVSVVRVADLPRSLRALPLATNKEGVNGGDAIILIGYPTALAGILARVDEKTAMELTSNSADADGLLRELAKRKLIRPLSTQGHIGDVRPDRLVYDAQTTSGGSGGPVIDLNGKVVGVNFAILQGFAGASFAVPVRNARELVSKNR
jgi:S1-C subfamily serine protease/DNA-binding NarL/FixJ family response regulator